MFGAASCLLCRVEHSCQFDGVTAVSRALQECCRVRRAVARTGVDIPDRLFLLCWRVLVVQLGWPAHFRPVDFSLLVEELTGAVFGLSALRLASGGRCLCVGSGLAGQLAGVLVGAGGESVSDAAQPAASLLLQLDGLPPPRPPSVSRAAGWHGVLVYRRAGEAELAAWAAALAPGGRLVCWSRWDAAALLVERHGEEAPVRRRIAAPAAGGRLSPAPLSALCLRPLLVLPPPAARRPSPLRRLLGLVAAGAAGAAEVRAGLGDAACLGAGTEDAHCPASDGGAAVGVELEERRRCVLAAAGRLDAEMLATMRACPPQLPPPRAHAGWGAAQELTAAAARLWSDVEALRRCLAADGRGERLQAAVRRARLNAETGVTRWSKCPLPADLIAAVTADLDACPASPLRRELLRSVGARSRFFTDFPRHTCGVEWTGVDTDLLRAEGKRLDALLPPNADEGRVAAARLLDDAWTLLRWTEAVEERRARIETACDPDAILRRSVETACHHTVDWQCLMAEADLREVFG